MLKSVKKMKDVQFYELLALLITVQCLLVFAGLLPPLSENNLINSLFFWLRMILFIVFGFVLADSPLLESVFKGGLMAFIGVVVEAILLFIGSAIGRPLLGLTIPSEFLLYLALMITAVMNIIIGAILVSLSAWFFRMLKPKSKEKTKKKKRKR